MYSYVCVCHILSKCINLQTRIAEHTCVRIMTHTFPRVHAFSAEDSVLPEENLAIGCYCHLTNNAKGPFGADTPRHSRQQRLMASGGQLSRASRANDTRHFSWRTAGTKG